MYVNGCKWNVLAPRLLEYIAHVAGKADVCAYAARVSQTSAEFIVVTRGVVDVSERLFFVYIILLFQVPCMKV